jgi:hypothetical protein
MIGIKAKFKINNIDLQTFFSVLDELDFYYRQININVFDIIKRYYNIDNIREINYLWLLFGIKFILYYVFRTREQPTSLKNVFELKLANYFSNKDNLVKNLDDKKIEDTIIEMIDNLPAIKNFLTKENVNIKVDDIIYYSIFKEKEKVEQRLKEKNLDSFIKSFNDFVEKYRQITQTFLAPLVVEIRENLITWINEKGFLLFYDPNNTKELKEFFKSINSNFLTLLNAEEQKKFAYSILECLPFLDDNDSKEIFNDVILKNFPTSLHEELKQKYNSEKEKIKDNFLIFLKKPDKDSVEKILKSIQGYDIQSTDFFNVSFELKEELLSEKDFDNLLAVSEKIISWINEEIKNIQSDSQQNFVEEYDFWLLQNEQHKKINLYFKFLYLSLNIYFNFVYKKVKSLN